MSTRDNERLEMNCTPCCCPLAEELHEAALHAEPEHARQVEHEGHEDEVERHPLVVGVVHDRVHTLVLVAAWNAIVSGFPK